MVLAVAFSAPLAVAAQQIVCQQQFGASTSSRFIGQVAAISSDSALLYRVSSATGFSGLQSQQAGLVAVRRGFCDTARFAVLNTVVSRDQPAYILRTRRGQVRVVQSIATFDSSRVRLYTFSRRGHLLWARTYANPPIAINERVQGLTEAPDGGTYITTGYTNSGYQPRTCLLKVDSLGRLQWRRLYASSRPGGAHQDYSFGKPAYTVRGNLLLAGTLWNTQGSGLILEINQRGDSLTSRSILYYQPSSRRSSYLTGIRKLRDGGFLLTSRIDSASSTNFLIYCGFTRLDANLNVQWTYVYRPTNSFLITSPEISQGFELADGSLLGAINLSKFNNSVTRLLHLSATGQLLQSYDAPNPLFSGTAIAPLSADSSFVLSGASGTTGLATLMQFRIPGLRRVLAEPAIPAAQVFLAARVLTAFPAPAYPNPATEIVTVPLPAGQPTGQLTLLDLAGRRVLAQPVAAGAAQARLPVGTVAAGTYLLRYEVAGQPPATQRLSIGP
jgi:hypothetical protein